MSLDEVKLFSEAKKEYLKPDLVEYGDIISITLGTATIGPGDGTANGSIG